MDVEIISYLYNSLVVSTWVTRCHGFSHMLIFCFFSSPSSYTSDNVRDFSRSKSLVLATSMRDRMSASRIFDSPLCLACAAIAVATMDSLFFVRVHRRLGILDHLASIAIAEAPK